MPPPPGAHAHPLPFPLPPVPPQTRHPAFMYVVSELIKVYGDQREADASMGPILGQLLGASCGGAPPPPPPPSPAAPSPSWLPLCPRCRPPAASPALCRDMCLLHPPSAASFLPQPNPPAPAQRLPAFCPNPIPPAPAPAGLTTLQALDAAPDLVDDSFLLAARAAAYCPRILVTPQLLPVLLDTALVGGGGLRGGFATADDAMHTLVHGRAHGRGA
jgi:hypothetical protein